MSTVPDRPGGSSPAVRAIITFDFLLLCLPPLHWWLGGTSPMLSVLYLVGSCLVVTLSLPVLYRLVGGGERA